MMNMIIKRFHPCNVNLIIGAIGILIMIIFKDLFEIGSLNIEAYANSALEKAMQSTEVGKCGVALLVSACPLFLDLLLDVGSGKYFQFKSEQSKQILILRTTMVFVTLVYGFQISRGKYFNIYNNDAANFYFGLWVTRVTMICASMSYLNSVNSEIFSLKTTTILSTAITLTGIIRFYGASSSFSVLATIYKFTPFLCQLTVCIILFMWIKLLMVNSKKCSPDDYKCILVLSMLVLGVFTGFCSTWYINLTKGSTFDALNDNTCDRMIFQLYALVAQPIILSVIPGRIARLEAIAFKDNIIETKESYVRYISHELRTPLSTVLMGIELSLNQIPSTTSNSAELLKKSVLEETFSACYVAIEILNDLLFYDKLQSGLITLATEKIHVWDFMCECIKVFKVQFRSNKLRIHMTRICTTESTTKRSLMINDTIDGDKAKLSQVVRNLLSNAIKFTPKGGDIKIDISVNSGARISGDSQSLPSSSNNNGNSNNTNTNNNGSTLVIEVNDSGAGISKSNQKRLFQEIIQFKPEVLQAGGGSGLGMFITKGIIDFHDGSINVHSEGEGLGTTFRVELPMHPTSLSSSSSAAASEARTHLNSGSGESVCNGNEITSSSSSSSSYGNKTHETTNGGSEYSDDKYVEFNFKSYVGTTDTQSQSHSHTHTQKTESKILRNFQMTRSNSGNSSILSSIRAPLKLLLVDDSISSRKMMRRSLEANNFICDEAEDGQIAVNIMKAILKNSSSQSNLMNYDAILMDFMMPNMNGPKATKEICELGYTGIIIGLTGNALAKDKTELLEAGCKHVLVKPSKVAEIMAVLSLELQSSTQPTTRGTIKRRKSITR